MISIDAPAFATLLNQIPLPISIFELASREEMDFKYVYVNDFGVQFSGVDRDFWIGKNTKTCSASIYDGVAAIPNAMMKVLDTQEVVSMDSVAYVDDTLGPKVSTFTLFHMKENHIAMVVKAVEKNKSISHKLSLQQQMLEMGEQTTGSCSWVLNEHSGVTIFTPSYLKVHHFSKEEINNQDAYQKIIARIHPDDREEIIRFRKSVHASYPVSASYRYLLDDHQVIWLKDTISQKRADGTVVGTTQNVTESRERESQLQQALLFKEKIMHTSPEVIYVYDLVNQRNIFANKTIFSETGYTEAEVQQLGAELFPTIIHPDDLEMVLHHHSQVLPNLSKGQIVRIEYRMHSKKSNTYEYTESVESLFEQDKHGNNLSIIGVSRSIHAQKQAEAEVLKKNKELEQFAFVASHDLQEPLRTITSFTRLLAKKYTGKFDELADQSLKYIVEASTHMNSLVKELLEYSRLGRSSELTQVDTNLILQKVLDDLSFKIAETNTTFDVAKLPVVRGYKMELRLLFQNLISNAIKFHKPNTPPRIKISVENEPGFWKFSFQDNGIGIAPQHQEKIFIIFQRLHSKREYKGTGIGLAHCQKIMELHGGEIWLDSKLHEGSTFHIRIPA